MKIYLAGFVPKGDQEGKIHYDWRKSFITQLTKITKAKFIDPRDRKIENFDESNLRAVFGLDCQKIRDCDLVIVNGKDLGVGGSQEILIAKYFCKRVIMVLPKNTTHRRSNIVFRGRVIDDWVHPFIYSTCDLILEDIDELTKDILSKVLKTRPKDLTLIDKSIKYSKKYLNS